MICERVQQTVINVCVCLCRRYLHRLRMRRRACDTLSSFPPPTRTVPDTSEVLVLSRGSSPSASSRRPCSSSRYRCCAPVPAHCCCSPPRYHKRGKALLLRDAQHLGLRSAMSLVPRSRSAARWGTSNSRRRLTTRRRSSCSIRCPLCAAPPAHCTITSARHADRPPVCCAELRSRGGEREGRLHRGRHGRGEGW